MTSPDRIQDNIPKKRKELRIMKKFVSILLCVMLLFTTVTALAEPITSVSGLFTYELPENCIKVDATLLDTLIKQLNAEDYENAVGMDKEAAQNLISVLEQVDFSTADLLYTKDMAGNVNVQTVAGVGLTQVYLPLLKTEFDKQLTLQYISAFGIAEEDIQPQELAQFGDNTYYVLHLTFAGMPIHLYITYDDAGNQLTFTFTGFDEEAEKALMESVVLVSAQAAE